MTKLKKFIEKPFFIIIFCSIIATISAWPAFILMRLGIYTYESTWFQLASAISALLILFVLPACIIKFILKKQVSDFGLRLPENLHEALKYVAIILVIFLPIMLIFGRETSFQNYYFTGGNAVSFAILNLISLVYYFSEEFIFRGFMHFSLWDKLKFHSIWVINLIFALLHFGKPLPEIFLAFFLGMVLNHLSYKTKSFIPAFVIHFILALTLNFTVTFIYPPQAAGVFHF